MEGLISFGVGAIACLSIGVCAVLAGISAKIKDNEDVQVPPFKERMKWVGFFLLYIVTFIVSVPIGIVVIIVRSVKNKKEQTSDSSDSADKENEKN